METLRRTFALDSHMPHEYKKRALKEVKLELLQEVVNDKNYVAIKFNESTRYDEISLTTLVSVDMMFMPVYERTQLVVPAEQHFFPRLNKKTSFWMGLKNCFNYLKNRNQTYLTTQTKEIKRQKDRDDQRLI